MALSGLGRIVTLGVCLLTLAACDSQPTDKATPRPAATTDSGVNLTPEEAAHLAIRTMPVRAVGYAPQLRGYGVVSSFEALAQAVSDVATAQAAVRQSSATLARGRRLASALAISRESLDAAERQYATDEAALTLAQRKENTTYGRDAPWFKPGSDILARLASGKLMLVHGTFPMATPGGLPPTTLVVGRIGATQTGSSWSTSDVWSAPADTSIPGRGYFALVAGSDLAEGERVLVSMPSGPAMAGALVPTDAMVISGDKAWFYVSGGHGVFSRRVLDVSRPIAGGYFVTNSALAGMPVVVQGAGLLLARELNPPSASED